MAGNENIQPGDTLEETKRKNNFCVIGKKALENGWRDLQTNQAWSKNPYGEDYAVVPDDMVADIMATRGFCNIELNEDGTEVVSFTALDIPDIPEPEPQPTEEQLKIAELEEKLAVAEETQAITDEAVTSLYEMQMAQDEVNTAQDEAIIGIYEMIGGE